MLMKRMVMFMTMVIIRSGLIVKRKPTLLIIIIDHNDSHCEDDHAEEEHAEHALGHDEDDHQVKR